MDSAHTEFAVLEATRLKKETPVDITTTRTTNAQWTRLVAEFEQKTEPIFNVRCEDKHTFDAIFVGGGRFGSVWIEDLQWR